jgi:hypothetical protein
VSPARRDSRLCSPAGHRGADGGEEKSGREGRSFTHTYTTEEKKNQGGRGVVLHTHTPTDEHKHTDTDTVTDSLADKLTHKHRSTEAHTKNKNKVAFEKNTNSFQISHLGNHHNIHNYYHHNNKKQAQQKVKHTHTTRKEGTHQVLHQRGLTGACRKEQGKLAKVARGGGYLCVCADVYAVVSKHGDVGSNMSLKKL